MKNTSKFESVFIIFTLVLLTIFAFYADSVSRKENELKNKLLQNGTQIYNVVKMPSGDIVYESTANEFTPEQIVSIMELYGDDWKDYSEENATTLEFRCKNLSCMVLATNKKYILFSRIPPIPEN